MSDRSVLLFQSLNFRSSKTIFTGRNWPILRGVRGEKVKLEVWRQVWWRDWDSGNEIWGDRDLDFNQAGARWLTLLIYIFVYKYSFCDSRAIEYEQYFFVWLKPETWGKKEFRISTKSDRTNLGTKAEPPTHCYCYCYVSDHSTVKVHSSSFHYYFLSLLKSETAIIVLKKWLAGELTKPNNSDWGFHIEQWGYYQTWKEAPCVSISSWGYYDDREREWRCRGPTEVMIMIMMLHSIYRTPFSQCYPRYFSQCDNCRTLGYVIDVWILSEVISTKLENGWWTRQWNFTFFFFFFVWNPFCTGYKLNM